MAPFSGILSNNDILCSPAGSASAARGSVQIAATDLAPFVYAPLDRAADGARQRRLDVTSSE